MEKEKDLNATVTTGYSQVVEEKPKIKRFKTYNDAFKYYLEVTNFEEMAINTTFIKDTSVGRNHYLKQNRWLFTLLQTLYFNKYKKRFSANEELLPFLNWETIDAEIRKVLTKTSKLSSQLREYLIDLFYWVDHFVYKEEEFTE